MTWDEIGAATREAVFVVTLGELDGTTIILDLAHMVYPACYGFAGELFDPNVRSSERCSSPLALSVPVKTFLSLPAFRR